MNRYAIAAALALASQGLASCASEPSHTMDAFVTDPYNSSRASAASIKYASPPRGPLDPSRKIAEQDCSQPIDIDKGNVRCK
jgi:hypothetical protein